MNQEDTSVDFPVVLYNGERQVNIGKIKIHPTINFQDFRTMLKQMIGISYNNLTTYFVENRRPETLRKILITSKIDFLVIMQETNGYFLVVLKRSRRDRRRKAYHQNYVELSPADLFDYGYGYDYDYPRYETVTTHVPDYLDHSSKVAYWLYELEMEREKHNNTNNNNNNTMMHGTLNNDLGSNETNFPSISEVYPTVERSETTLETQPKVEGVETLVESHPTVEREETLVETRALCEGCMQADKMGVEPEFHLCVYDEVVEGVFRSPAGPICRPM